MWWWWLKGDVVVEWECLKFGLSSKAFSQGGYRNAVSEFSLAVNTQESPDASGTMFTIQIYSLDSLYCCIVLERWTTHFRSSDSFIAVLALVLLIRYAGKCQDYVLRHFQARISNAQVSRKFCTVDMQ